MLKPNNYDNTTAYGDFEPFNPGGHIMVINHVDEGKSKAGRDMLLIYLDAAPEDSQAGYFAEQFRNKAGDKKKWGCIFYQPVEDKDGNCNRGLKTFITAVEESNPGFAVQWGDNFCKCFTNRKVGGVFGREQYRGNDGKPRWSTKCRMFRSVQAIIDGVEVPEDKYLKDDRSGYGDVYPGLAPLPDDDDAPFPWE